MSADCFNEVEFDKAVQSSLLQRIPLLQEAPGPSIYRQHSNAWNVHHSFLPADKVPEHVSR